MNLTDIIKTASGNLNRHLARSLLSMVGVTVGILTIVTMLSLGVGVRREIVTTLQKAGLQKITIYPTAEDRTAYTQFGEPKRTVLITPALIAEMKAREDVVSARPLVYMPRGSRILLRIGEDEVSTYVARSDFGLNDPFLAPPEFVAGRQLTDEDQGGIVVTTGALEDLGYETQADYQNLVDQELQLVLKAPRGDIRAFPFRVVGVFKGVDDSGQQFSGTNILPIDVLTMKAWWYNTPEILEQEGYDALQVQAASLNDATQIVEELESRGFQFQSVKQILDMTNKLMVVVQAMLGSIGALALLVASIGIVNTMIMAVYERTREIGVLKAIGASPADIRALFVVEAGMIGFIGGVIGTIAGWLLGLGLNELILAILRWKEVPVRGTFFLLPLWLIGLALLFATVVGLLAGLYPAARAARLAPLDALRYE